ncbi:PE-PGRS FAMILY PROTEIN [Indibacter alkaliphilus LW1]|uniref:PE-PGRS FAMILY PROTEIN n=1 Tax=Indibacter alkaliphilus (strain CCUG 57479 / KCTC 22604 / LW1) TaxID=1189612 RepID=S2DCN7_INDAL|nr:PE-PGRS FAMILY PROTEIN [Indibacter alkaliphilus LW1]
MSGLSQISNFGSLEINNDFNGNWSIDNFGEISFSINLNSNKTINNYGAFSTNGDFVISSNSTFYSNGTFYAGGSVNFNSNAHVTLEGNSLIAGSSVINTEINLSGSYTVNGALQINSNGGVNALNGFNNPKINVLGSFNNNGKITGNGLDKFGNTLFVNKSPGNNPIIGGFSIGDVSNTSCLEIEELPTAEGVDRIFYFSCSDIFIVPNLDVNEEIIDVMVSIIGGGGGGGLGSSAGGGGAGGVINADGLPLKVGSSYPVAVGSGGPGAITSNNQGINGTNSAFYGIVSKGGGGGGSTHPSARGGVNGASGGGGGANNNPSAGQGNGGSRIAGIGNTGGTSLRQNQNQLNGGGGGGAGGPGENGRNNNPGNGGDGIGLNILAGSSRFSNAFAGGGGSTGRNPSQEYGNGTGGEFNSIKIGGDGDGREEFGIGNQGLKGTGSGGGAGRNQGGTGSSGVVVIRFVLKILPVEYLYFEGVLSQDQKTVGLSWATAKEWESSHFEVLRSFDNIDSWEKVGEVEAAGYSESPMEYSFEDNDNFTPFNMAYYQLRQVDFDESSHLSKVIGIQLPVNSDQTVTWRVYPNPASNQNVQLSILEQGGHSGETVYATLFYPLGRSIQFTGNTISELSEQLNDALKNGGRGVYILNLLWGNENQQLKVLKN